MSRAEALSRRANARIRGFSALVSVAGVAVILLLAAPLLSGTGRGTVNPFEGADTSAQHYDPWENPSPTAAKRDGDAWTGRGQQYIPLTGLTPGVPLKLTVADEDNDISGVFLSPTLEVAGDEDPPEFGSYLDETAYLIPATEEATVWMRVRSADEWTVRIEPAQLPERSGLVSGTGAGAFRYTGDATAARITTRGRYSTRIDVVTVHGLERKSLADAEGAESIAWKDTDTAVFVVDTIEDTSWAFEFFERDDADE